MEAALKPAAMVALAAMIGSLALTGGSSVPAGDEDQVVVDAQVRVADGSAEFTGPNGEFSLALPTSGAAARGVQGGSQTEVIDEGTTLRSTTEISETNAATFGLVLPEGARAESVTNDDGEVSILITDAGDELLGGVAAGGAVDANGNPVATELTLSGDTITQVISAGEAPAYPVQMVTLAGTVWYMWANVDHADSRGYRVNANPTALGRQQIAWNLHSIHVQHVRGLLRDQGREQYWNWNIEQQFVCHVVGAWFPSGVYNMESWQPSLAWGEVSNLWDRCNRIKD